MSVNDPVPDPLDCLPCPPPVEPVEPVVPDLVWDYPVVPAPPDDDTPRQLYDLCIALEQYLVLIQVQVQDWLQLRINLVDDTIQQVTVILVGYLGTVADRTEQVIVHKQDRVRKWLWARLWESYTYTAQIGLIFPTDQHLSVWVEGGQLTLDLMLPVQIQAQMTAEQLQQIGACDPSKLPPPPKLAGPDGCVPCPPPPCGPAGGAAQGQGQSQVQTGTGTGQTAVQLALQGLQQAGQETITLEGGQEVTGGTRIVRPGLLGAAETLLQAGTGQVSAQPDVPAECGRPPFSNLGPLPRDLDQIGGDLFPMAIQTRALGPSGIVRETFRVHLRSEYAELQRRYGHEAFPPQPDAWFSESGNSPPSWPRNWSDQSAADVRCRQRLLGLGLTEAQVRLPVQEWVIQEAVRRRRAEDLALAQAHAREVARRERREITPPRLPDLPGESDPIAGMLPGTIVRQPPRETPEHTRIERVEDAAPIVPGSFIGPGRQARPESLQGLALVRWLLGRNWCTSSTCQQLLDQVALWPAGGGQTASYLVGLRNSEGEAQTPEWWTDITAWAPGWMTTGLATAARAVTDGAGELINWAVNLQGCNATTLLIPRIVAGLLGVVERWIGWDVSRWRRQVDYLDAFLCPTEIPTTAESVRYYLSDTISWDRLQCWSRANDQCPEGTLAAVRAERTRPSADQLVRLWLQGYLVEADYLQAMRQVGVIEDTDRRRIEQLAIATPSLSDLVRFMVRDVFDPGIVTTYQYDAEFADKFRGKARDWAIANGATEEIFRYHWRAHWQLPSPTQLYEMLHRLRPGRVPDNVATTRQDIVKALLTNDLAPYWVPRLAAISYKPLTRVDVQRGYRIGAFDRVEVKEAYLDLGYDEQRAEMMTRYTDQLRAIYERGQSGSARPAQWVRWYRDRVVSLQTAQQALLGLGLAAGTVGAALERADQEYLAQRRSRIVRASAKRYLTGEWTSAAAVAHLIQQGLDLDQSNQLVEEWETERGLRSRQVTASQLCRWLQLHLITPADFEARLGRLGYSKEDARHIVSACGVKPAARTGPGSRPRQRPGVATPGNGSS